MSYNFGKKWQQRSINFHTPEELCSVKYNDLDHAVKVSLRILGDQKNSDQLFFAKSDFLNAFRILPGKIGHRCLLVIKIRHPLSRVIHYFVDKCLPFGTSISCVHFQSFSDAIKHIVEWKISCSLKVKPPCITNYLDDFLFIALSFLICNQMVEVFLDICSCIGCPISDEKTEWTTQLIVFLGILLNGINLTMAVPIEKRVKAISLLRLAVDKRRSRSTLCKS